MKQTVRAGALFALRPTRWMHGQKRAEPRFFWFVPPQSPLQLSDNEVATREQGAMTISKKPTTRGFASMDPEKQKAIARKGGESVPDEKRSFSRNPTLAAEAGRKGGHNVNPDKRSFSQNHDLASAAGRKGGQASQRAYRKPGA